MVAFALVILSLISAADFPCSQIANWWECDKTALCYLNDDGQCVLDTCFKLAESDNDCAEGCRFDTYDNDFGYCGLSSDNYKEYDWCSLNKEANGECKAEDWCTNVTAGSSTACVADLNEFCYVGSVDDCYYLNPSSDSVCTVKNGQCVYDLCSFREVYDEEENVIGCSSTCKLFSVEYEEDGETYTENFCADPCYVQDVCNDYYNEANSFNTENCAELGCSGTADFEVADGAMTVCTSGQGKLQPEDACESWVNPSDGSAAIVQRASILALVLGLLALSFRL